MTIVNIQDSSNKSLNNISKLKFDYESFYVDSEKNYNNKSDYLSEQEKEIKKLESENE